jgi:HTH-type transcriptional regulator, sugar sensing transcriptional regulator
MTRQDTASALVALGFSTLEAETYTALVEESPATGYRVSQLSGRPLSNTYKALESLAAKGAIDLDEGGPKLCRAVPPDELLARIKRDFTSKCREAERALAHLTKAVSDDRVYQLQTVDQLFERCRAVLARAERTVVADTFPGPLVHLSDDLQRTAARGLDVALIAYEPVSLDGVEVVLKRDGAKTIAKWPGHWLNLSADGAEFLIAMLSVDGTRLHQAIWTRSEYLSFIYHSSLTAELVMTALETKLAEGAPRRALLETLAQHRRHSSAALPGYRTLFDRLAPEPEGEQTPSVAHLERRK